MEESRCPICLQEFNSQINIPLVLHCGHSICSKCIPTIFKHPLKYKCPLDQKEFDCPPEFKIDNYFPVNYALRNLLEEKGYYEKCEVHGEKKKLICKDDKMMVCKECVFDDGKHEGHKILTIKKAKKIAEERKEGCNKSLKHANEWKEKFKKSLDEEKIMLNSVQEMFKKIRVAVEAKVKQIVTQVQEFFQKQKKEMESIIGDEPSIVKTIEKEIKDAKEVLEGRNLLQVLKFRSENLPKCNEVSLQKQLKDLNQTLGQFKEFAKIEKIVMEPLNSFDFKFTQHLIPDFKLNTNKNSNKTSTFNLEIFKNSQKNNNIQNKTINSSINLNPVPDPLSFINSSFSSQKSY